VDADLVVIRQCKAGNGDAFASLVARYQREALAHARAILPNVDDARDAVQEAFVDGQ
jgi:DNA-directed RNA polymerase specialized sigma24 family protein